MVQMVTRFITFLIVIIPVMLASAAWAQSWPAKPLRIIVGFAPGGAPDTMTRLFAERLPAGLSQPVVVKNRPAAGGLVAAGNVSRAAPDMLDK